ncbi:MAG: GNAT family N-acetyltransferase [Herpetosiphonaceae bacterium]|nr:GNAT family N-acetyltransferase [Herpetosiphonaceae bacterium]
MHEQLPNVGVWMLHRDLSRAPRFSLPPGYRMRFYHDGDLHTWLRIQATDPFSVPTAETFARSMPGDTLHLAARVMFLVDPLGADIGTITAWNNDHFNDCDIGQIHWVAIIPAAQGRGLAKPMLSAACDVLRTHGYAEACLETNTARIPALNLYPQFGFEPYVRDEAERNAWRTVAPRLKIGIAV